MNLGDIRHRVLSRADESDTPVSYSPAEANNAINAGLQLFALLTLCLEGQYALTINPGIWHYSLLPLIPNLIVVLRVSDANSIKVRPSRISEMDAVDSGWKTNTRGATRYGFLGFDFFAVNGTGISPLTLTFARSATPLANDPDVPEIPEQYHPALVEYGIYHLLEKQGGQWMKKGLANLGVFLEAAGQLTEKVRDRAIALRYDKLPVELERKDLSRILTLRKDLLPARKSETS